MSRDFACRKIKMIFLLLVMILPGECMNYLNLQSKLILVVLKIFSHLGEERNEFIKYSGS